MLIPEVNLFEGNRTVDTVAWDLETIQHSIPLIAAVDLETN